MSGGAPECPHCLGKFPKSGDSFLCEACDYLARINNLLRSSRFPPEQSVSAGRCLRDSYHFLLESADRFWTEKAAEEQIAKAREEALKTAAPKAKVGPPEEEPPAERAPTAGPSDIARESVRETPETYPTVKAEPESPKKESNKEKRHRRTEKARSSKKKRKSEDSSTEEKRRRRRKRSKKSKSSGRAERAQSVTPSEHLSPLPEEPSGSSEKSPIRRWPDRKQRPAEPAGPPPERARGRWEGAIPAYRGAPRVEAPKGALQKSKNKGKKKRERDRAWRAALRDRR